MLMVDASRCRLHDFYYTFNGIGYSITLPIYDDVLNYFTTFTPEPQSTITEFYQEFLKDSVQRRYIDPIISTIFERGLTIDDQARIAISLVQRIPYDREKSWLIDKHYPHMRMRFPYEVLANRMGICSEKSLLLALLLREIGFGVALFVFEIENHMTVGIKCEQPFSYYDSGFAFIETTGVSIVTDDQLKYTALNNFGINAQKLASYPEIIPLCDGEEFSTVHREFFDAKEWNKLIGKYANEDGYYYLRWRELALKYGIG